MRKDFLPFSPPYIAEEEIAEVVDSLHCGGHPCYLDAL